VTTAESTSINVVDGKAVFTNNLFYGNPVGIKTTSTTSIASQVDALIKANNTFENKMYAIGLFTAPYNFGKDFSSTPANPNFTLSTGSAAATGASFTNAKVSGTFFDKVAYRGAFGTEDWTASWTHFDPQSLNYTTPGRVTQN